MQTQSQERYEISLEIARKSSEIVALQRDLNFQAVATGARMKSADELAVILHRVSTLARDMVDACVRQTHLWERFFSRDDCDDVPLSFV